MERHVNGQFFFLAKLFLLQLIILFERRHGWYAAQKSKVIKVLLIFKCLCYHSTQVAHYRCIYILLTEALYFELEYRHKGLRRQ